MRITVAIPTRERAEFLRPCLATCVAIADPDLEIVVADNAGEDDTRAVVEAFADPRIRHVRAPARISQRLNFEAAVAAATGDYVCVIGDDDAMLPGQYPAFRAVLEAERPDVLSPHPAYYRWPAPGDSAGGRLKLRRRNVFGALRPIAAADYRRAIETAAPADVDTGPKLYHGFVARPVLERLRARTGWVFGSGQVDLYFAAAALSVIDRYLFVAHPATVLAMGPKSGGRSVQRQYSAPGNASAARVAAESLLDTVAEPIPGRMPVLSMYLLTGLEQARRMAFGGDLALDYGRYLDRILAELAGVPAEGRALGAAQIETLLREVGRDDLVPRIAPALAAAPPPNARTELRGSARLPAYVTPAKVALDLRRLGGADVLAASRALDHLLGPRAPKPQMRGAWAGVLARGAALALRQAAGLPPGWGVEEGALRS